MLENAVYAEQIGGFSTKSSPHIEEYRSCLILS